MALQILSQKQEDDYSSIFSEDDSSSTFSNDQILKFDQKLKQNAVKQMPTTAAAIKREYLLRDYSTQTDYTEILDIKHLQEMSEALVTDLNDLKSEAQLTEKHIKIQQDDIMKTAIKDLENKYEQQMEQVKITADKSINRVRRAAKQEVADMIAQIKANFMQWHEIEIKKVKSSLGGRGEAGLGGDTEGSDFNQNFGDLDAKAALMLQNSQKEIQKLLKKVSDLNEQLEEANNKEPQVIVDNTALNALQEKYDQQTLQIESLEGEKCKLEISNSKLTTEVHDLNINIKNYQVQIEKSDKEKKELEKQLIDINKKMAQERLDNAKKILELKDEFNSKISEMETEFTEKITSLTNELKMAKSELDKATKLAANSREAAKKAEEKAKKEAEKAAKEKEKANKLSAKEDERQKRQDKEDEGDGNCFSPEAMALIKNLKTKCGRLEKMYEKKIEIMNNQMHTLKDENFIRQQLQRDSLLLHKVDVRYQKVSKDSARGTVGTQKHLQNIHPISNQDNFSAFAPNPIIIKELKSILPDIAGKNGVAANAVLSGNEIERPSTTPGKNYSDFKLADRLEAEELGNLDDSLGENDILDNFKPFET